MKKGRLKIFLLIIFAGLAGVVYQFSNPYGIQIGSWKLPFNEEKFELYQKSNKFLEFIQFKDFQAASQYHHPDKREKKNIAKLIEDKFHIKPELLDITYFEVLHVDIDSTGVRGKVKTAVTVNLLNTKEIRDVKMILYYRKQDNNWYMELESSL